MDGNSQSMEVMSNFDLKRYLYMTTSGINDSKLYLSEMKSIFGNKFNKPNFILDKYIEPSRSVYIRGYIDVLFESESISEIVKNIENANLSYEKYKIKFIKSDEKIEYSEWITALKDLGTSKEVNNKRNEVDMGIDKLTNKQNSTERQINQITSKVIVEDVNNEQRSN